MMFRLIDMFMWPLGSTERPFVPQWPTFRANRRHVKQRSHDLSDRVRIGLETTAGAYEK